MSVKISDLMKTANSSLKGKWLLSIGVSLVSLAILIILAFIPILGSIVTLIVLGPLLVGLSKYFISLTRNEEVSFNMLFEGFSNQNFARSFVAYLLFIIFLFLWSLIFIIPFAILIVVYVVNSGLITGDMSNLYSLLNDTSFIIFILLSYLLLIPAIIAAFSYSMTFFIIADEPEISGFEAIKKSVQIMKGNKGKLFLLYIIFSILAVLCVLTLGIAYLWLIPFAGAVAAAFYNSIK
ncbi:MAG: DUF975 family protein [Brevinematia bacterium]